MKSKIFPGRGLHTSSQVPCRLDGLRLLSIPGLFPSFPTPAGTCSVGRWRAAPLPLAVHLQGSHMTLRPRTCGQAPRTSEIQLWPFLCWGTQP